MEAIVAFGLASNIVAFVDFGLKVVSKGHHIYRSNDGSLAENNDLEVVTNDLLILQTQLSQSTGSVSAAPSSVTASVEEEKHLRTLLAASNDSARRLLALLNKAKAQGRFRRWKSLRQAVKSVCSKNEVDDIARRLSDFRSQLQTRLILSLRYVRRSSLKSKPEF